MRNLRHSISPALILALATATACSDDTTATDGGTEIGQEDSTVGDGDGDEANSDDTTGDGDGEPTTGDGDGDGEGDGDGDGEGDGDGDGESGDGDGDGEGDGDGDGDGESGDGDGDGDGDGETGDGDGDGETGDGDGDPIPSGGSCRPSETYGAAGDFPEYEDPNYADFLDKKVAIVTHNSHSGAGGNVVTIVDISGDPPPPNMNYLAPLYWQPQWSQTNLGRIFGLTLDSYGNIYVAPTTIYGANPAPNTIKRIDAVTGQISNFVTLPNNGPAFGHINYDCTSETLYVSNHEDGRIYQVDMDGQVVSTYKHSTGDVTLGMPNDPGEPNGQFVPLGQRPWAVQSNAGRLYYSVWVEHYNAVNPTDNNEVWSVAYVDETGVPDPATAKKEFSLPNNGQQNGSSPVSDISFAHTGWMLVAQRSMMGDSQTTAHQSTTFEYDYQDGVWVWQGTTYVVGELLPYSAAGGVDHDFDPEGYVWMTGDALDFYTPNVVYGLQGTPYGGGGIQTSTIIDLDHEITQQDKTVYGDVELPIPGDADPVPPPT